MKHFVVGLPFTAVADWVALIRKNRPDWQAGKLNGPGGKLEAGETAVEAMSREMAEESGVAIPPESWTLIAVKQDEEVRVDIFACFDDRVGAAVSLTDEAVSLHTPNDPIIDTDGLEHIRLLVDHALKRDDRVLSLPTSRPEAVAARRVAGALAGVSLVLFPGMAQACTVSRVFWASPYVSLPSLLLGLVLLAYVVRVWRRVRADPNRVLGFFPYTRLLGIFALSLILMLPFAVFLASVSEGDACSAWVREHMPSNAGGVVQPLEAAPSLSDSAP